MVGHKGNYDQDIAGVEAVDGHLASIIEASKRNDYAVVITSDHGNCEEMRDDAVNTLTNHTVGKVWCFVLDSEVKEVHPGALNNVAPTVLKLMGIEKPHEMDMPLI